MMKSIRAIGFVVGVIVLAGWVSLLWSWLRSSANSSLIVGVIHNIFGHWQSIEKSEIVASIIIVFNLPASGAWIYGVCKTVYENKDRFLLLSTIWICLNLLFFLLFGVSLYFTFATDNLSQVHPNAIIFLVFGASIYALLFVISFAIFDYMKEIPDPRLPQTYMRKIPQMRYGYAVNGQRSELRRQKQNARRSGDLPFHDHASYTFDNSNQMHLHGGYDLSHPYQEHGLQHYGITSHSLHGVYNANDWPPSISDHSHHNTHSTPSHSTHDTYTTTQDTCNTTSNDTSTTADTGTSGGCDTGVTSTCD